MPIDQLAGSISDASDGVLLSRVAAHERDALGCLYHKYVDRLATFLAGSIGDSEAIEEIINNTFVEFWGTVWNDRLRSSGVSTWMFQIAFRKAFEYLHQRGDAEGRPNAARFPLRLVDAGDDTEHGRRLRQGLDTLLFEERSTLVLAYRMGFSPEEIAAITRAPVGVVKAWMLSARDKIRRFLPMERNVSERADVTEISAT
jgi:RNA polymerase sigma-70 factor, ECF subfamily